MAKRPTLTDIAAAFASASMLNDNFDAINEAFDNTLSLDGSTPNAMLADLDMNGFDILNVGNIESTADSISRAVVKEYVADTRAEVAGKSIDSTVNVIRTGGYATVGDGGHAIYKKTSPNAEPSHAFKVQSADGAWWEGVPEPVGVSVHQFGAKGDDSTDDTDAIQDAIDYANSQSATIWLHRGKTYRVTGLSMNKVQNFTMRSTSSMPRAAAPAASILAYHGTAGGTLLYLHGVLMADIEGVVFKYGSAAPDAYIKTDFDTGFGTSTHRLHNVLFFGNGKSDGSIGFDMGPNSSVNDSDHDWGRVEFRNIELGWRFNHSQNAGYYVDYIRSVGTGKTIHMVEGGNLKIGTYNSTNVDFDIDMDAGGSNVGTLTVDNAHVEWSPANASAKFLQIGGGTEPCTAVLNNPIVQNGYSGIFMSVLSSARVIVVGGLLNGNEILVSGLEDKGDAVLLMEGCRYQGTITTNDWGYYRHASQTIGLTTTAAGNDPFGGDVTRSAGSEVLGHDAEKMKSSFKRYFEMPLTRPGGATVLRKLPSNAEVTGIDLVIEDVGSATGSEEIEVRLGGTAGTVGTIAVGTAGPRHFGWAANDLDAADTDTRVLGSTAVLSALDSNAQIQTVVTAGSAANARTATAHLIVEYVVRSVKATGISS